MYMTRSPVDELARLRARIAELRAREAALEARFIEGNDTGRFAGYTCDVVVSRTAYQVFDISKLPRDMLNDDRYYATKHVTSIRVEARDEIDERTMLTGPELQDPELQDPELQGPEEVQLIECF